jgi:hypothetical protein
MTCPLCGLRFSNPPLLELHIREDHPRWERHPAPDYSDSRPQNRRGLAWLVLTISLATLAVALALEHGLILAAGLALAGTGGDLIERQAYNELRDLPSLPSENASTREQY